MNLDDFPEIPLGYQQITTLSSATGLVVPPGATFAVVIAEGQSVRWCDDGTTPTATAGMLLPTNTYIRIPLSATAVSNGVVFIQTAASATLNVSYYGINASLGA